MTIEENSAAVDGFGNGKSVARQPPPTKLQGFLTFLFDRKSGTVLGRTGRSWFEITVFYIIFYSCLAGFFAINMAVFLYTLDPTKPRYYGKGSIIGINPGMGYQPWIETDPESTLIRFYPDDNGTYAKYTSQLSKFLKKYNYSEEDLNKTRTCNDRDENNTQLTELPCRFNPEKLLVEANCTADDHYGFRSGQPCVLLTLNKLIEWEPVSYSDDSAPVEVATRYKVAKGDVAVACEGEYAADQESLGPVGYFPPSGIDRKIFPYRAVDGYRQAFAVVKFAKPPIGVLISIECKAYSLNIIHDRAYRLGMVHFELLVEPTREQIENAIELEKNATRDAPN